MGSSGMGSLRESQSDEGAAVRSWPKSVGDGTEGGLRFLTRTGHSIGTEGACLQLNLWVCGIAFC